MERATPESVGMSSERLARIAPAMQGFVGTGRPPGLITLVARRGKVVHLECQGLRDVEGNQPMEPDTIVRIYSMTKPVTSVALMTLFEEGRFTLDEPVAKYIPELGRMRVWIGEAEDGPRLEGLRRPITIQDLLTHTAGLAYGVFPGSPIEDRYLASGIANPRFGLVVPSDELIRQLVDLPLAHQPGSIWRYSVAHDVLAHLVSVLAHQPFDAYLRERIFGPLDMVDTGFAVPDENLPRFSALYADTQSRQARLVDSPTCDSFFARGGCPPAGGTGLVSTASDYLRFAQMLLNGGTLDGARILGPRTLARMTMNHLPAALLPYAVNGFPRPGMGYGLGFGIRMDPCQMGVLCSPGAYGWGGASGTTFWVDPAEELIGIFLPQVLFLGVPAAGIFQNLVYQAIVD
jgi:CubicO group peptidase (beta-lactamase class C family)